jgi:hypothetical protein
MAPEAVEQLSAYKRLKPNRGVLGLQIILAPITICFSVFFITCTHDTFGVRSAWFASFFFLVLVAYPIPYFLWMISRFRREGSRPEETRFVWACLMVGLIKLTVYFTFVTAYWVSCPNLFAD